MIEAMMALLAYTLLNVLGPAFAVMRMRKRQSSSDVSIGWIVLVLSAVVIIFIYSLAIGNPVFIYGQMTGITAQSIILSVILYYRFRKPKSRIPDYVDHLTQDKFSDYVRAQLEDMKQGESGGWYEAKEIADIVAISIQRLMEMGMNPAGVMRQRIKTRYINKENMLEIMDVYADWWKKEFGDDD